MSQFSALKLLEERASTARPWVCVDEAAEELGLTVETARKNLYKLMRYGEARSRFDPASGRRQFRHSEQTGI